MPALHLTVSSLSPQQEDGPEPSALNNPQPRQHMSFPLPEWEAGLHFWLPFSPIPDFLLGSLGSEGERDFPLHPKSIQSSPHSLGGNRQTGHGEAEILKSVNIYLK